MSASTTTSAPSPQGDLFPTLVSCPTLSRAARRARTSAAPTQGAKASTARGRDSTSKPSGWSENAALAGSLLRTALTSELAARTGCSMRWRRSATPSKRAWWVLEMSVPAMSANGPGSLATIPRNLPTPVSQSQQGGMRMEGGAGARAAMKVSGLYDLFREQRLPTPMASDGMPDGGGAGSTYPFRAILATPRASDAAKGGRGDVLAQMTGQENRHAGMLGTPTANPAPRGSVLRRCKGRMTSEQDDFDRTPTIAEALYFEEHQSPYGMLPTPLVPNGGRQLSAREIGTGRRGNGSKAQIDTPNLLRHEARGRWRCCCGAMG